MAITVHKRALHSADAPGAKESPIDLETTVRGFYKSVNGPDLDRFGGLVADEFMEHERVTGTDQGEFVGMPATGKSFDVKLIDIIRFGDDGLAYEHWEVIDSLAMMQQLCQGPSGRSGGVRAPPSGDGVAGRELPTEWIARPGAVGWRLVTHPLGGDEAAEDGAGKFAASAGGLSG